MRTTRHASVQFGVYQVDLDEGELRKSGVRIKVQQQPFKVLQALLERPGELVTREQLHDRIWPEAGYGDFDQAVNVAVAKLRAALGDTAENPRFIETVPRRGYRLIAPVRVDNGSEILADSASHAMGPRPPAPVGSKLPSGRSALLLGALVAVLAIVVAIILFVYPTRTPLSFHRITYGKGAIRSARFGPGGDTVLYGAAWNGNPTQVFWAQGQRPESRPYPLQDADILAVSPQGELALLLNRRAGVGWISHGTLAIMPIAGGAPREVLENVQDADWDPDGKNLAIVHWTGGRCAVEFPVGNVLYAATGGRWLSDVRLSPRGDSLAFLEHPLEGDDAGYVQLVNLRGDKRVLTRFWFSVHGLAWDPSGDSLWFTASDAQSGRERPRAVFHLTLSGTVQRAAAESGDLTLHDVSRNGTLLLSRDVERYEILANVSGATRDLSWLDFSRADDLSADGKKLVMTVEGEAAGTEYEVYLRNADGSPPVRLGEGYGSGLSPDGQWVLAIDPFDGSTNAVPQLVLLPVGKGLKKNLTRDDIAHYAAGWFPDGKHIVFLGSEPGHGLQTWMQDLDGNKPQAITPEGVDGIRISPDGTLLCAVDENGTPTIYPVSGGQSVPVRGAEKGEVPVGWSQTGQQVYVARPDYLPVKVYRLDRTTGKRELVRELAPSDSAGVIHDVSSVFATPDAATLVYSYFRLQSDLYTASPK
jgi:DNA-binding winged helix-turn-helix (wHTH) protein/Tol biopolymer transport system component